MGLITKIFGTRSQRELKRIQPTVDKILALEGEYAALSDEELKGKTAIFKARYAQGETLDELLPEANREPRGKTVTIATLLGFAVMMFLDMALS